MNAIRMSAKSRKLFSTTTILLALSPAAAPAATSVTPVVEMRGQGTDNAGDRPEEFGPQRAVTATAAAGGRIVWSRPLWSIRLEGLGEYERYLSAAVRNTGATGGLDGRWRPDERTFVRSISRASYAPDRWDPRVPYRLAIATPEGEELPPFIRATTMRVSEHLLFDRRATELWRVRALGGITSTQYDDRRFGEPGVTLNEGRGESIDPRLLQGRTVFEGGAESLWALRENVELGVFGGGTRADYEVTPDAYNARAGAVFEWRIGERSSFRARTGPDWTTVPGTDLPDRWGYTGDASLMRRWTLAEIELAAREGAYFADATIPAARRTEGRFTVRALPFERLSIEAYAGAGMERSMYAGYHETGTARSAIAGTALGWRMTEHLTAKAGYQHSAIETNGRSELPHRSNTVFVGMSFTGWSFGSPAPETNP